MLSHVENGRIKHKRSPIDGTGSFSVRGHKAGEVLGVALIRKSGKPTGDVYKDYHQTLLGDYFNHSPVANVGLRKSGKKLIAYATKDIAPGEEMVADYREPLSPVKDEVTPEWDRKALAAMSKKASMSIKKSILIGGLRFTRP